MNCFRWPLRRERPREKHLLVTLTENKLGGVTSFNFVSLLQSGRILAPLILALLVCGCSSFNREWRRAGQKPVVQDSLEGRWEGRWLSDANGHNGKLRCIISHQTNDTYAARFRASYLWVLRFSYIVPLTVESQQDGWRFQGEADLGAAAGGVYHYDGSATQMNFHSTYRSSADHGVFEMNRIAAKK